MRTQRAKTVEILNRSSHLLKVSFQLRVARLNLLQQLCPLLLFDLAFVTLFFFLIQVPLIFLGFGHAPTLSETSWYEHVLWSLNVSRSKDFPQSMHETIRQPRHCIKCTATFVFLIESLQRSHVNTTMMLNLKLCNYIRKTIGNVFYKSIAIFVGWAGVHKVHDNMVVVLVAHRGRHSELHLPHSVTLQNRLDGRLVPGHRKVPHALEVRLAAHVHGKLVQPKHSSVVERPRGERLTATKKKKRGFNFKAIPVSPDGCIQTINTIKNAHNAVVNVIILLYEWKEKENSTSFGDVSTNTPRVPSPNRRSHSH